MIKPQLSAEELLMREHYGNDGGEEPITKEEILKAMKELKDAAEKLTLMWTHFDNQDALCGDYPFEQSFDEVVSNITTWVETTEDNLK